MYGKKTAVNKLNLQVKIGECLGLLGANGAGKTTTFKMMTADELMSSGDVFINGFSMRDDMVKAQKSIGYCPQYDALMLDMTGREQLKIFALIRGISRSEINASIKSLAKELELDGHLDKKSKLYSGGIRRKLSVALALIGDPDLILLDEPFTGIDLQSKQKIIKLIKKRQKSGTTIVFSSHSMEECEAMCTRIAIMVDGEIRCNDSIQTLKSKYAEGLEVKVQLLKNDKEMYDTVSSCFKYNFPTSQLKENDMGKLIYHVSSTGIKWSELFEKLNMMKENCPIADFSVSQLSLENVFHYFLNFDTDLPVSKRQK